METHRMTIDVFSHRVDHYVCAVIQWVLHVRTEEGIVHNDMDSMSMCYGCNFSNIYQTQRRIARAFNPDQFRFVRSNELGDINFNAGRKRDLNAVGLCYFCEIAMSATVNIRYGHHMRASRKGL